MTHGAPNAGRVASVSPTSIPRAGLMDRTAPALVIIAIVAGQIWLTHGWVLFSRPLWLDEIHTLLVAGAPDTATSMRNLAAGADFNPPALYLVYRVVALLSGTLSEVPMRLLAAASVAAALIGIYYLLRDDLGRMAAAAGALTVWAHPTVISAAFDARFYGPWLAGVAALLLVIRRRVASQPSRPSALLLALTSAFVCTIHYFGVVSWIAAMATAVACVPGLRMNVARRLLPAAAGPVALAMCIPLYLSQRSALTRPTWIPRASLAEHAFLLANTLLPLALVVALLAWGASVALKKVGRTGEADQQRLGLGATFLLGQAAVPLGLAVFSMIVQPATQPRYWIAGCLAVAAASAFATARSTPALRAVIVAVLVVLSTTEVSAERDSARRWQERVRTDSSYAARAAVEKRLIVARRRHTLYPMLRADHAASSVAVLFDGKSLGPDSQLVAVDREVARIHRRIYGFPRLVDDIALGSLPLFYFVEYDSARAPIAAEFPRHTIERIDQRLFRLAPR
jgi:hypothetical protein